MSTSWHVEPQQKMKKKLPPSATDHTWQSIINMNIKQTIAIDTTTMIMVQAGVKPASAMSR